MRILYESFGIYQTNCYIVDFSQGQIIIDPGEQSHIWIKQHCPKPLAILNTHGHFDHIWDNAILQEYYKDIPLICHKLDAFLLEDDIFNLGITPSKPTFLIEAYKDSQTIDIQGIATTFHHFPGHTPGCCIIEMCNTIFSGDFVFYRSIGRSDFAYSNPQDMKESLQRFEVLQTISQMPLYPGHGQSSVVKDEQANIKFWLPRI